MISKIYEWISKGYYRKRIFSSIDLKYPSEKCAITKWMPKQRRESFDNKNQTNHHMMLDSVKTHNMNHKQLWEPFVRNQHSFLLRLKYSTKVKTDLLREIPEQQKIINTNLLIKNDELLMKVDTLTKEDINRIDAILEKTKNKKQTSLLELDGINSAEDITNASERCIVTCNQLMKHMFEETNIFKVINIIDTVSNILCKLGDFLELLRNLHVDSIIANNANTALERITYYIDEINMNLETYHFLKNILRKNEQILNKEHKEVLHNMLFSMENQGVHIVDEKERKNFLELQSYEKYFSFNVPSPSKEEVEGLYIEREILQKYLGEQKIKEYEQRVTSMIKRSFFYSKEKYIYVIKEGPFIMDLLEHVNDQKILTKVYTLLKSPNQTFQNYILHLQLYRDKLIQYRQFPNYSAYALKNCILNDSHKVNYFLNHCLHKILPCFYKELEFVEEFIKRKNKIKNEKEKENTPSYLSPSNLFFYMNEIKKLSVQRIEAIMEKNLHLFDVIVFVIRLLREVYSIDMKNVLPKEQEIWDETILKFELRQHDHLFGYLYMDLFEREGKNNSIAQYTLRCSKNMNMCLKYRWLEKGSQQNPYFFSGIIKEKEDHKGVVYRQITSTFLVCNFNLKKETTENEEEKHTNYEEIYIQDKQMRKLLRRIKMNIDQVNMFMHEFGHTLHCILSSTYLQHLSGNRGGVDFSEFTSHFFEEYLNNYEGLLWLYSQTINTNNSNMKHVLKEYMKNKYIICYYPLVQFLIQAIIDQIFFFFSHTTNSIDKRKKLIESNINDYFKNMCYKNIPILDFFPQTHFSKTTHLIHYPANYYSYIYCSVLCKYIWGKVFTNNIKNQEKAKQIVEFMKQGSVDSSLRNIIALVENDPEKIEYFVKHPHKIPLEEFLSHYEKHKILYDTFLENL